MQGRRLSRKRALRRSWRAVAAISGHAEPPARAPMRSNRRLISIRTGGEGLPGWFRIPLSKRSSWLFSGDIADASISTGPRDHCYRAQPHFRSHHDPSSWCGGPYFSRRVKSGPRPLTLCYGLSKRAWRPAIRQPPRDRGCRPRDRLVSDRTDVVLERRGSGRIV